VFPDVAEEMSLHLRSRLAAGAYDTIRTVPVLAESLNDELRALSHDKHLRILYLDPDAPDNEPGITEPERERRKVEEGRRRNYGFERVERLEGNVGYLDLRSFFDAKYAGETASAAMNFLANADAVIFDLRQNGGGEPNMVQFLLSYLFDRPAHLNDFVGRGGGQLRQYWTLPDVPGPCRTGTPVYVLTSGATFSAAEEFVYDLQSFHRAVIVGEVTGGGAHMVRTVRFPSLHVGVGLPFARAVNPNTGTNWEGKGITPDVRVPADHALTAAHLAALARMRDAEIDPDRREILEWIRRGVEARARGLRLEPAAARAYTGTYGPRRVTFEEGSLYYQREGRPRMRLIPAGDDLFLVEDMEGFRVLFARDADGRVTRITGLYEDGHTDENARTGR
jgi:retinol-binding protein 3